MKYTIPIEKEKMVCARKTLSISPKSSITICRAINRKNFNDAKKLLEDIASEKKTIRGKFYSKTVEQILELLNDAEKNAKARNFDLEKLKVFISSHKGPKMYRARRKRIFGMRLKSSNIQVVLSKFEDKEKSG